MTKRWSSTRSDLTLTKRDASRKRRAIDKATLDKLANGPMETAPEGSQEFMDWLHDAPPNLKARLDDPFMSDGMKLATSVPVGKSLDNLERELVALDQLLPKDKSPGAER